MKLGMQVGLGPGHILLDGDPAPFPKGHSPQLSAICGGQMACMDQNATWFGGRPPPRRLCLRWEPRSLPQKGGAAPKFSAHVYCGQTAGWIKMALATEVGLSTGDFVLDRDPAPSQ